MSANTFRKQQTVSWRKRRDARRGRRDAKADAVLAGLDAGRNADLFVFGTCIHQVAEWVELVERRRGQWLVHVHDPETVNVLSTVDVCAGDGCRVDHKTQALAMLVQALRLHVRGRSDVWQSAGFRSQDRAGVEVPVSSADAIRRRFPPLPH